MNAYLLTGLGVIAGALLFASCWQNLPIHCTSIEIDGITANVCVSQAKVDEMSDHLQALGDRMAASAAKYQREVK